MATKVQALVGQAIRAAMICGALATGSAHANLIYQGPLTMGGTGVGAVDTMVLAHDPGGSGDNNGTESACIERVGSADVQAPCHFLAGEQGGDNQTGAGNQTYSLSSLAGGGNAVVSGGELGLIVNISEIGQDQAVTLTGLYLSLYNSTTNTTENHYYMGAPLVLTQANQSPNGLGQSGYLFTLDAGEVIAANSFCAAGSATCFVGGGVQFAPGTTDDGNETVFVTSFNNSVVPPQADVPEPDSLALVGIALLGGALARRAKQRSRAS